MVCFWFSGAVAFDPHQFMFNPNKRKVDVLLAPSEPSSRLPTVVTCSPRQVVSREARWAGTGAIAHCNNVITCDVVAIMHIRRKGRNSVKKFSCSANCPAATCRFNIVSAVQCNTVAASNATMSFWCNTTVATWCYVVATVQRNTVTTAQQASPIYWNVVTTIRCDIVATERSPVDCRWEKLLEETRAECSAS